MKHNYGKPKTMNKNGNGSDKTLSYSKLDKFLESNHKNNGTRMK